MGDQIFLVEEYIPQQTTKIGVTVENIEDIHFAQKIGNTNNGVYYMKDQHGKNVAVFKPSKEESLRRGEWKKGDKADREVAAFLLDHPMAGEEEGLGRVPPTTMVCIKNFNGGVRKEWDSGSLQKYIPNQPWIEKEVFAIDHVQTLSLIDMRFGNNDRHKGNILNSNINGTRLIPIDHGECFPKEWDNYKFVWTDWSQAKVSYPSYMIQYVKSLNVETDLENLKLNGIELGAKSVFVYKIQNMVLKAGVMGGYLPSEIGKFMTKFYVSKKDIDKKKDNDSKRQTILDVMEQCMKRQPIAGSEDESKLLKLIHERTTSALEFNRKISPKDGEVSTSTR